MIVRPFPSGPYATNAYAIICSVTNQMAIVDPSPGSTDAILKYAEAKNAIPDKILLTHSHWDHIADVSHLKSHWNIPVYVHAEDAGNLIDPGSDGIPLRVDIVGVQPDFFLKDGEVIQVGEQKFQVIHTPGHSPGGVCFYCKEQGVMLSGDTLFKGTMGTLAVPTAQPNLMWKSLKRLSQLPAETIVFPGHGARTTIGAEPWLPHAESIFGG